MQSAAACCREPVLLGKQQVMDFKRSSKVYLVPREKVVQVDWDGLVDKVFKEEVDQFFLKSEMQALQIDQGVNRYKSLSSTSNPQRYPTFSSTSSSNQ